MQRQREKRLACIVAVEVAERPRRVIAHPRIRVRARRTELRQRFLRRQVRQRPRRRRAHAWRPALQRSCDRRPRPCILESRQLFDGGAAHRLVGVGARGEHRVEQRAIAEISRYARRSFANVWRFVGEHRAQPAGHLRMADRVERRHSGLAQCGVRMPEPCGERLERSPVPDVPQRPRGDDRDVRRPIEERDEQRYHARRADSSQRRHRGALRLGRPRRRSRPPLRRWPRAGRAAAPAPAARAPRARRRPPRAMPARSSRAPAPRRSPRHRAIRARARSAHVPRLARCAARPAARRCPPVRRSRVRGRRPARRRDSHRDSGRRAPRSPPRSRPPAHQAPRAAARASRRPRRFRASRARPPPRSGAADRRAAARGAARRTARRSVPAHRARRRRRRSREIPPLPRADAPPRANRCARALRSRESARSNPRRSSTHERTDGARISEQTHRERRVGAHVGVRRRHQRQQRRQHVARCVRPARRARR